MLTRAIPSTGEAIPVIGLYAASAAYVLVATAGRISLVRAVALAAATPVALYLVFERMFLVSLPHGWGHSSSADGLRVAGPLGGPNLNALTDEDVVDPLTGTAALNGVPVEVSGAHEMEITG